jgi:hypothetical protein
MYRQQVPELGLSIEMGTDAVPDDGRYYVLLNGEIIYSSLNERQASRAYTDKKNQLFEQIGGKPEPKRLTPEQRLEKERANRDIQAMRMESFDRRASGARKKGGRGGRGGVP